MKLQTQIPLHKETHNPIDYQSKIFLLGSCFSEQIGTQLKFYKFQTVQNPFGILFHPKAIEKFVTNAVNEKEYSAKDIIFKNERWHSFDAHSSVSSPYKDDILNQLNTSISSTNKELKKATHIIVTLGTSWVYRHLETDTIVANCHKIPQKKFLKELLSVDEIIKSLDAIITLLKSVNPAITIIFTASPIRHLKDGFVENTRSKGHLIAAIHQLLDAEQSNIHYFPSYEIMMDELRDYRFYAEDMIHPNKTAIRYIWEKFITTWFVEETLQTMQKVETIQKGIAHKPFNQNSEQHQQFLKNLEVKKMSIQSQFPTIKFD